MTKSRALAPILERANILGQLRVIREKIAELETVNPRLPKTALEIQRLETNIVALKKKYIHLVADNSVYGEDNK